jgi:outer membrane protein TolC
MNNQFFLVRSSIFAVVCCLLVLTPHQLIAKETALMSSAPSLASKKPISSNQQWAKWILSQVETLPSLKAMESGTLVANEQRNAMRQPLFNPELGAFYTDKDDEEYGVIVSQKIDWFDKRSAKAQLGQVDYELVSLSKVLQTENKLSDALLAYIEYSMAKQLLAIAKKQETLLTQLASDLKLREDAGDVGRSDAEMAYLSLLQNLQQISLTEIRYRKAQANLKKTLNSHSISFYPDSSVWINSLDKIDISNYFEKGLTIQVAKKELEQSISQAKIAHLNKKVNPTIGVGAGRDGRDNTILFEISIPLNVRNNYSSEYRASLEKVNQTEFELKEEQRLLKNEIQLTLNNYEQLKQRVLSWQKLTSSRLKASQKLLDKQWRSGDITTSDHLFSLRQRTDTLIADIELTAEMQKAWIEWLLSTSQVRAWLKNLSLITEQVKPILHRV